jgi:hypothetical protein
MAFIFGDSFDHYYQPDLLKKWTGSNAVQYYAIATDYPLYPHGSCLYANNSASYYLYKTLASAVGPTFVSGVWWRPVGVGAQPILAWHDASSGEHVSVRCDATAHLTFTRNGTVLATSTNTFTAATWYHIEAKVTIGDAGDSPSGQYEVRVDGTATNWIPDSGTGKDTRNAGSASIQNLYIWGPARFNDYYLLTSTGDAPTGFLGPCRFVVLRPVGVGSSSEWTGTYADNYVNVCEQVADGDNTFNESSTATNTDLFALTDVPAGTIHAIQHVVMARKDAGAARTIRAKVNIGGTTYNQGAGAVSLAASYVFHTFPAGLSPSTATAWDDAEINAMEGGYELVS